MKKENPHHSETGTATVEMAIIMPVYVMLIIVMVYFGGRQVMNIRIMKEVNFLSQKPGEQDVSDLPEGFLDLPHGAMDYLRKDITVSDIEIPSDLDEEYIKEVMVENMYSVTGTYVLEGDTLVYSTSMNVTGFGHYAQKFGLVNTVDEMATELDKGITRTETTIDVELEAPFSVYDEDVNDEAFESGGMINRQETTEFVISHSHSHVLVNEEHMAHNNFINYEDTAIPALLPENEYPKLPDPSQAWTQYWQSNLTTPP